MAASLVAAAKIVEQRSHLVPGKLRVTEHFFDVPKDYSKPQSGTIRLFARSVRKHESPAEQDDSNKKQLPWMVYLNGGPGGKCSPPTGYPFTRTILEKGYQLLFLDQRGTGMSTPVTPSTLGLRGYNDTQAKYLKLYRADNIARDCEAIRQALLFDYPAEKQRWSTMGQSFGGFITISYLSFYPEGLKECFIFGGLQPLVKGPDEVYRRLYKKVIQRNEAYYQKYPEDIERVKTIVKYLKRFGDGVIKLPSEGHLTARRFQQIGLGLGFHGGVDNIHDTVLRAAYDIESFGHITHPVLSAIERATSFDDALIYSILHEPIYCEGTAPNWSADRIRAEYPEFDLDKDTDSPIYFTGEMIYPWMFTDYAELRKVSEVASLIASTTDWDPLFDTAQLGKNTVPVYAAAYTEDMYVDFDFSKETASKIKGCKMYVTNVMYHDAVRNRMDEVVKELFALRDDVID